MQTGIVCSLFLYNEQNDHDSEEWKTEQKGMERSRRIRSAVILEAALLFLMGVILWENGKLPQKSAVETTADGYIKWVDFNVSYEALSRAYEYDISSYGEKQHLDWIDLLAYVGAKNGGDFGTGELPFRVGFYRICA